MSGKPTERQLRDELDELTNSAGDIDDVGVIEPAGNGQYRDIETGELLDPEDVELVADFTSPTDTDS